MVFCADYSTTFMKRILCFLFCFYICLFTQHLLAQNSSETTPRGYKYNNNFDVAFGIGSGNEFSVATSLIHLHGIGKAKKLKIGYGIRLTNYFGITKIYKTAPAKLINENKIHEIELLAPQTNSVNAVINLQYSFSKKFELGFNIDVIGFSFGKQREAKNLLTISDPEKIYVASPTSVNILLVDKNDIGSLNSEFYLRCWISPKAAVRIGFSHLFSEYTTTHKLLFDNDRYRLITNLGFVAFTFSPYR